MADLKCINCKRLFDEDTKCIPKVLPCGHSMICSDCLGFYLTCPDGECSTKLPADMSNLPTNLSLLSVSKNMSNISNFQIVAFTSSVNAIKKDLDEVYTSLEPIQLKTKELDSFSAEHSRDTIMSESLNVLDSIKERLQDIERNLYFGRNTDGSIDIKHYSKNEEILLSRLMDRIATGEKMYAAGMVNDQMKFGKVYLKRNGLFINSLSITERDENTLYFWLCDFRSLLNKKLCSFFVFPCNGVTSEGSSYTMVFDITENNRKSGFLELCTGETGASFKDSSYFPADGDAFEILLKERNDMKINYGVESLEIFDEENIVIRYISGVNWELKRVKNNTYPSPLVMERVVARLIDDIEFPLLTPHDQDYRTITESGIAVFKTPINTFKDVKNTLIQKDPSSKKLRRLSQGKIFF